MADIRHDSSSHHVSGESVFVNDMEFDQLVYGHVLYSPHAHANIISIDTVEASKLKGVVSVLTYKDIPGKNQMGPVIHDEACLAEDEINFIGQAVVLVAAITPEIARKAALLVKIEYKLLPAILSIEEAMQKDSSIAPESKMECGDVQKALKDSENIISGELHTGAQEHWYLETQSCICVPGEGTEIKSFSSTQHPSETQEIIAGVLNLHKNEVEVEVRRLGGAFGGKETQANHVAAWSALLAYHCRKPVKIHLFRDDDQIMTGKRHPFLSSYKVGFNNEGIISALNVELNADAGSSTDLSLAILQRALFHVDNAYFIPNLKVTGRAWKTNYPSNTAFRGFGGPQGMAVIENIIDRIARELKTDAAIIRQRNFYGTDDRNLTHYGQIVENNRIPLLFDKIINSSDYYNRRESVLEFNSANKYIKRGLALTPVKFGISFTTAFLNQAGALINIYKDGSVLVNHGGIEMGQGLNTKIIGIVCDEFGIDKSLVKVSPTTTSIIPNTSATAASSGSDMNGMAVKLAIDKLISRITELHVQDWNIAASENPDDEFLYQDNHIIYRSDPGLKIKFPEIIKKAYLDRISLSATGFYKTPDIHFNSEEGSGIPFHYYSFGMAVSEVKVDTLTGFHKILRTDIVHDVGKSLNPGIDRGQIEGGFIQGVGWCTIEEIKWDEQGRLMNHSPDTYKIPTIDELPLEFRIDLLSDSPQPNTIRRSKAIGEPPFMLAFSVWLAIKDAISAVGNHQTEPDFRLPATNEVIVGSAKTLR